MDDLSDIKKLSGLVENIDMPHDAEITPEEAFAMVKAGRWDIQRFNKWIQHHSVTHCSDDDYATEKFTDIDYKYFVADS